MIKKIKSLTFCLLLFISASFAADWTGSSSEPEIVKKIDGKMFYVITRAEEFAWFAEQVNSGKSTINAVLANDIKFMDDTIKRSSVSWTPIGKDSSVMFNGIFDGAGRTIYGLYCNQKKFAGIFGVTGKDAEIKNVKTKKSSINIEGNEDRVYAGGIVAFNWGTVTECINRGSVSVSADSYSYVGGIAGWNAGSVMDCVNEASCVSSFGVVVVGYFAALGGIVGWNEGSVIKCTRIGQVSISADFFYIYLGGIVGWNSGVVIDCINDSYVETWKDYSSGWSNYDHYVGGVVGLNSGSVRGCVNNASISIDSEIKWSHSYCGSKENCGFNNSLGGVVGRNEGSVMLCINKGRVFSTVSSSYSSYDDYYYYSGGIVGENAGTVAKCVNEGPVANSPVHRSYSGGVVAYNLGSVTDCKNLGNVSTEGDYAGGLVGKDSSDTEVVNSFSAGDSALAGVIHKIEGKISNCYYDSSVLVGLSSVSPNVGMPTADMQKNQFAWILNTTNGTASNSEIWSRDSVGYPVFADSSHKPIYKIVFENSGTIINRYTDYKGGVVDFPADPEAPEGKVFNGWYTAANIRIKNSTIFSMDQTVHAVYIDAVDIYYSIRFFDSDLTLLDSQYVQYGKIPDSKKTPYKASSAKYCYSFDGWNIEPTAATKNFDYYATYIETICSYTVKFLDYKGLELQSSVYFYGAMPNIPKAPTRRRTSAYTYTFVGWDPAIDTVTGPATYTAVFDSTWIPQSSSSVTSSSSSAVSSSSSAGENSSSSSEPSDAIIANIPTPTWSVTASGRNFQIHAAPVGKSYALFDLQGKVLAKGRVESSEMTLSAPRAGSYIVRVGNHSVRMNAK